MPLSQGLELRAIGHKQDGVTGLDNDLTARNIGDNIGKASDREGLEPVSSTPVNESEDGTSERSHITASQARVHRWKNNLHFAALCYSYFLEGWNDGSLGPLLPRIQQYYNVSVNPACMRL